MRKVVILGSSGMIGRALRGHLKQKNYTVETLSWRKSGDLAPYRELFSGAYAVINLSGRSIFTRWNLKRKAEITYSRVHSTKDVVSTLADLPKSERPEVLITVGGVHVYQQQPGKVVDERTPLKDAGFLSQVTRQSELASAPLANSGVRTVHLRLATVDNGIFKRAKLLFKLGLGTYLSNSDKWMPWVSIFDVVGAIEFALSNAAAAGAINVTSPRFVTERQFFKAIGKAVGRPVLLKVPRQIAKFVGGQMFDELLDVDYRVAPTKLESLGYEWKYPELERALNALAKPNA